MAQMAASVRWRRLDGPGHEVARLLATPAGPRLEGTAELEDDGAWCVLRYAVACDPAWRTVSARVSGVIGARAVDLTIAADGARRWHLAGVEAPAVAGCEDLDLQFSPATNLLPIRRLALGVGEAAPVSSAWLRFPALVLERLDQVYRRLGASTYRYEVADGSFARELDVDAAGFVTRYPGLWEAEPPG